MSTFTFKHTCEWSDCSEHSPRHYGQLPDAMILPDGRRLAIDTETYNIAAYDFFNANPRSNAKYIPIDNNARILLESWGDDGSRSYGRSGSTLKVVAPKGTRFLFARYCPMCGGKTGEMELPGKIYDERADPLWHKSCKAENDEQERLVEEARIEQEEYARNEQEAYEKEMNELYG